MNPEERLLVAILDDTIHTETPHGRAIRRIAKGLEEFGITIADIASPAEARARKACRQPLCSRTATGDDIPLGPAGT